MSLLSRFRKAPQPEAGTTPTKATATPTVDVRSAEANPTDLRAEVGRLYDRGVDPIHTVRAMLHELDGSLTTDAERIAGIWLGVNDFLDRDYVVNPLRTKMVDIRDVMAETIRKSGEGPKAFVDNYRENTRKINEMKFLQAYKPRLVDEVGVMQLDAVRNMIAEIEHARANDPGSLAQDISEEKLSGLYSLRDNWNESDRLSRKVD